MRAHLDTYNLEMWSILREQETCTASVKELEEVLAAEESTDEEAEMRDEKSRYDAKRVVTVRQEVVEEDKDGDKGESEEEEDEEEDEDEDEPVRSSGLSASRDIDECVERRNVDVLTGEIWDDSECCDWTVED